MILRLEPGRVIEYSHFSPLSGLPDAPENCQFVTMELSEDRAGTIVSLSQDNNRTEEARAHAEANWQQMLSTLKTLLEGTGTAA